MGLGPDPKSFLGVERSITGRRWIPRLQSDRMAQAISQQANVSDIMGRILAARGVLPETAAGFLEPTLRDLMPPAAHMMDVDAGASRLADAVMAGEAIGLIGDYDVDGMTSSALMVDFLTAAGVPPRVHIPHRVDEGYGPSVAAVEDHKAAGVQLLITLDCGVMAHDPLLKARELGMDTVIVDHHQAGDELPQAHAVINPNRQDDTSGQGALCAAGVVMVLIGATSKQLRTRGWWSDSRPEPDLMAMMDLVALGTVCDVVPLVGLNRAYVRQGLKVMARRDRLGVAALADVARLSRRPDAHSLGFVLGPRLNAAGRIGSAMDGLALLTSHDKGHAMQLAQALEEMNKKRQAIELATVDRAVEQAEAMLGKEAKLPVLVVAGEGWHPGVLGLVASRLKERFDKPAFAIGLPKDGSDASGSARSIAGVNLGLAVQAAVAAGVAVKGGGHAMAAGITLEQDRLGDLRAFLEQQLAAEVDAVASIDTLTIDAAIAASGASTRFIEDLDRAGPFGQGNPSPVFALPSHKVVYAARAGADHVRCTLVQSDGTRLKAIAFRAMGTELGEVLLSERQMPLHIAGQLTINDWGGKREGQVFIYDAAEVPGR
ncbi:single-stranded-DNA-specific exonuclease RecJ [Anderseniella sp. Alg231-50]|uniref:single-stranded-DNA-specific exonuclease RecJ n=1 Tax=Anderseniella sp. Alg231-50 TaxID=1922226 RepID=UPI000D5618F3